MDSKELLQESQYHFPYHHLSHEREGGLFIFRHLFWGLEHYTYIQFVISQIKKHSFNSLADIGCGEGRILTELSSAMPTTILNSRPTARASPSKRSSRSSWCHRCLLHNGVRSTTAVLSRRFFFFFFFFSLACS